MIKYVYVLTSSEADIYYEQALVSVTSLRMHMPEAWVALVVDGQTANSLAGKRSAIKDLANELIVIPLDNTQTGMYRSRELKTNLRNLIDGDFLYIDTDTVIVRPLPSLDAINCEIGAVLDRHYQISEHPISPLFYRDAKLLGFSPYKNNKYFNGGVFYVRDTPKTRSFFSRWNELWHYCTAKKIFIDMPSLAQADYEFDYIIQELPNEWNCQIPDGFNYLNDAYIMHFFTPNNRLNPHPLMNPDTYREIKSTGAISEKTMNIIKKAQSAFLPNAKIVLDSRFYYTESYDLYYTLYLKNPAIFRCLNWCNKWILKVLRLVYKILKKWLKKQEVKC
jgi:hypothetical protein